MKKIILLFFSVFLGLSMNAQENKFLLTPIIGGSPRNISPNGRYVVGEESSNGAYLWDLQNSTPSSLSIKYLDTRNYETKANGVTDDAIVVGKFVDDNYVFNGKSLISAGLWENDSWISLGLGRMQMGDINISTVSNMPAVEAVTADGKTIVGYTWIPKVAGGADVLPFSWKDNGAGGYDTITWSYPGGGQGAKINSISADGNIACGWSVHAGANGNRYPIVWTSPTQYKIIGSEAGECYKVSDNGKYIAMTYANKAAIYKVETDEIIIARSSGYCIDVSDDGIAIGFYNININQGRKGFVWSENLGYIEFSNFVTSYASDITLPEGVNFYDQYYIDTPICISRDGKTIIGWSAFGSSVATRAWALSLAEPIKIINRPQNLVVKVDIPSRNIVNLSWEKPQDAAGLTLAGYKIYCNDMEIAMVDGVNASYLHTNVNIGKNTYFITALYEGGVESPGTDKMSVLVVDSYEIPYLDDFEYYELSEKYWKVAPNLSSNRWYINPTYPNGYKGTSVSFSVERTGKEYSESLYSRPFDATELSSVYLSCFSKILVSKETQDTLYVEILDDVTTTNWKTVAKHPIVNKGWGFDEYDISQYVAGKLFQIRFRATGDTDAQVYVELDNFQVRSEKETAEGPKELKAIRKGQNVDLAWRNPLGSYALSYSTYNPYQAIGNESKVFIGANKFEPEDLEPYKGLFLTSLTVYITHEVSEVTSYKIVAFEGTEKVREQEVLYFMPYEWNTFSFDEPLEIKGDKPLYFGVEVSSHGATEKPLYTDTSVSYQDGKGNLFSEDDGKIWQKLSTFDLIHNWCIIGNVREEADAEEWSDLIWGYDIFRNGIKLNNGLVAAQTYRDDSPGDGNVCYTVKAYHAEKAYTQISNQVCIDMSSIKNDKNNKVVLYPNPITDGFSIKGLDSKSMITVTDMNGRSVLYGSIENNQYVPLNVLDGMYIIKVVSATETIEFTIIKK